MCMEDVLLGRSMLVAEKSVTVTNGAVAQIVEANRLRVHLMISVSAAGFGNVTTDEVTPSATVGQALNQSSYPVDIDIKDHGIMVCSAWKGYANGANVTFTVRETLLPKEH